MSDEQRALELLESIFRTDNLEDVQKDIDKILAFFRRVRAEAFEEAAKMADMRDARLAATMRSKSARIREGKE